MGENALVQQDSETVFEEIYEEDLSEDVLGLNLEATISSLLFVSPRPLSADRIAEILETDLNEVVHILNHLKSFYQEEIFGFSLQEINNGWQFRSSVRASWAIKKLFPPKARRLSRASFETLSIIAYKQPVQRVQIEAIRGVDSMATVKTLLDEKLIRIVGHEDVAGQPTLYGTTEKFLEKFGLKDLSDLPSVRDITALVEEPGEPV